MSKAKFHVAEIIPGSDTTLVIIRNDDIPFKVGDWFGGQEVLKIEMYGKEVEWCYAGQTAGVTLSGVPSLVVEATHPEHVDWLKEIRKKK